MKIISISDTHNKHDELIINDCDVLIHAGDATFRGSKDEVENFAKWFESQPGNKIWVPGNHELGFYQNLPNSLSWFTDHCSAHVLINESVIINDIKFYGSPVTPYFHNWAWNEKDSGLKDCWSKIPKDTDILITHGPAYGINDTITPGDQHLGCWHLLRALNDIKPLYHICGHIHGGYGITKSRGTVCINASVADERYRIVNKPIEFEVIKS